MKRECSEREDNPLQRIFDDHDGRRIHKWSHYFDIYHRHFGRFRGESPLILEIGVQNGGSLQMWKKYFGEGVRIVGADIDERCRQFEEPGIHIRIGDQGDVGFLKSLAEEFAPFDIVIDDGGHTMKQQLRTMEVLMPCVSSNGVFLTEDTHSSYFRKHAGGYRRRGTFIEHCKGLIDKLHAWHITRGCPVDEFTRTVDAIAFYDSVVVFEKRPRDQPKEVASGVAQF